MRVRHTSQCQKKSVPHAVDIVPAAATFASCLQDFICFWLAMLSMQCLLFGLELLWVTNRFVPMYLYQGPQNVHLRMVCRPFVLAET